VHDQTRANLDGKPYDLKAALAAELHSAACCQNVVAVTEAKADPLRSIGYGDVSVIGHVRDLAIGGRDFDGTTPLTARAARIRRATVSAP
jgi:hypothetical protein